MKAFMKNGTVKCYGMWLYIYSPPVPFHDVRFLYLDRGLISALFPKQGPKLAKVKAGLE